MSREQLRVGRSLLEFIRCLPFLDQVALQPLTHPGHLAALLLQDTLVCSCNISVPQAALIACLLSSAIQGTGCYVYSLHGTEPGYWGTAYPATQVSKLDHVMWCHVTFFALVEPGWMWLARDASRPRATSLTSLPYLQGALIQQDWQTLFPSIKPCHLSGLWKNACSFIAPALWNDVLPLSRWAFWVALKTWFFA